MAGSYLFYDIETSGLNKCFDQVLQFAAIRTDLELRELERYEIFVKLNPDIIPAPTAVLVHQLTLDKMQRGVCEYEAIQEIHQLFNTPETITVGYNNLGFDDEFLRFSFYRNLLPPYTHQYANNCRRMDIYPMIVMYYLFKSDVLAWPKINGAATLKLEHLNLYNKLIPGQAHEAMCDVEVTLELARILKKEQEMWHYLCGYFKKTTDLERLQGLTIFDNQYQQALLIDGSIGGAKCYQFPVIGLGVHYHYKNQSLWLSLEDEITASSFVKRKRFGEPPILLPLIARFSRYLHPDRLKLVGTNLAWLQKNPNFFLEIAEYHKSYKYPEIPDLDIDALLYQHGFMTNSQHLICTRFHAAQGVNKVALLDECTSEPTLRTQILRVLGRNYQQVLATKQYLYEEFMLYLKKIKSGTVMVNYKNESRLTPQAALAEIEGLRQSPNLSGFQEQLLVELAKYIQSW